jgi:hypothetical protein
MFKLKITLFSMMASVLLSLVGCTSIKPQSNTQQLYEQAIGDSAIASPEKILPLLALPASESVTVVSWVTATRIPCAAEQPNCSYSTGADRVWVTLDNEVKQKCQSWKLSGDNLRRRLEQLLGLPMDSPQPYRKVTFITIQVPRDRLERACLGINEQDSAHPHCTLDIQAETSNELKNYVLQQMAGSYVVHNPKGPGYPFTRLGYTYDWNARSTQHYGASEFLIMPNTSVTVIANANTDDYCRP